MAFFLYNITAQLIKNSHSPNDTKRTKVAT